MYPDCAPLIILSSRDVGVIGVGVSNFYFARIVKFRVIFLFSCGERRVNVCSKLAPHITNSDFGGKKEDGSGGDGDVSF